MLHPLSLEYRRACLVEDREWVDSWLRAVPTQFAKRIRRQHNKLLFSEEFRYDGDARRAANLYVQDCRDHFAKIGGGQNLAASHDELRQAAVETVQHILNVRRWSNGADYPTIFQSLSGYLAERGVFLWDDENAPEDGVRLILSSKKKITFESQFQRITDEKFWRTVYGTELPRKVESEAIRIGLVNQQNGLYVSDDTLARFRSQRCRNRALLESLVAFNELGDKFTLAELADLSVSNPDVRRAELMTRIAGFEAIARSLEHVALFLTITCPSLFHAFRKLEKSRVIKNPKYNGSTPRQAQQYLSRVYPTFVRSYIVGRFLLTASASQNRTTMAVHIGICCCSSRKIRRVSWSRSSVSTQLVKIVKSWPEISRHVSSASKSIGRVARLPVMSPSMFARTWMVRKAMAMR